MPPRRRDTLPKTHRRVSGKTGLGSGQQRRISRREREAKKQRRLYIGIGIAAALVVLILAGSALNEYWLKPRHVLASVDGSDILRRDYWKYRAVDLADQANQYASIAQSPFVDENQRQQYVTMSQQANAQIDDVWGSTDLDDATLQRMIDDKVYLKSLEAFSISITDEDVQNFIDQRFEPSDAPIFTPTPSPTLIPERAEWATQTAVSVEQPDATLAQSASPFAASPETGTSSAGRPEAISSPVTESGEAAGTPIAGLPTATTAAASPIASPLGTAQGAATLSAGSPSATTEPSPTPNQEQARQTATANFSDYQDAIFDRAHLSRADYVRLIVRPSIARERITQALTADIGQRAEQVHAAHILVDTKDLADAVYNDIAQGIVEFEQSARDQSIDSGTAANGGDLGWFTRGQMVDEFEEVAFTTSPGSISQPVQTQFGWHIIKVIEQDPARAMTEEQITQVKSALVDDWLATRKSELDIESEIDPTATSAAPESFVPPPDAPPLPIPTILPTEVLPPASPMVEIFATPVVSSIGSTTAPAASPVATP